MIEPMHDVNKRPTPSWLINLTNHGSDLIPVFWLVVLFVVLAIYT